jgi:hypothetical protein
MISHEESEIIQIFNSVTSPFVAQYNAFEFALAAHRPRMTTLEARQLLAAFDHIHATFFEHDQRKMKRIQEKKNAK